MRVWVVDDDPGMRALLVRATSSLSLDVTVFENSSAALEALSGAGVSGAPNFIITDYQLGDGNGGDVARAAAPAPAILMTGTASIVPAEDQELFVDMLEKPFRLSALYDAIDAIRHTLRGRKASGTGVRAVKQPKKLASGTDPR